MVHITDCQKMFWGVILDAGKRYTQVAEQSFHISMAALEINANKKPSENVQVMLHHDSTEYLLCTLHNNFMQQPLDLNFSAGEEVSFSLNGSGIVHLTGYLLPDEEDESLMMNSEDDEDTEIPSLISSADDSMFDTRMKRKLLHQPIQKSKRLKLLDQAELDDEDDEDDEDYSEEEEGFSDDDEDEFDEDSFDDDEDIDEDFDEDDSDEDEDSAKKIGAEKTPAKSPKLEKKDKNQKQEEAKTPKQEVKTPKQKGSEKQNGLAKQQNTPTQKAADMTSSPAGEGESAKKKKKKKKKKKNKSEGDLNNSAASTPGAAEAPKSAEATPSGTPKKRVVAGGTVVEDLKVGHGPEAKPGKMVSVYYVGTLAKSNKRFDSCTDGKPFRFRLNQGEVIKGWDVGLTGMKVGGKRKITVPATQGYGNRKEGPIPPNSTLIFEVELKAVS